MMGSTVKGRLDKGLEMEYENNAFVPCKRKQEICFKSKTKSVVQHFHGGGSFVML